MSADKLLLIETSSTVATVALAVRETLAEREIATPREQSERLLGLVDALLAEAGLALDELDALVFGRGPGSFTGLRVAAAVIQGLALARATPIVAVSSLAALAERAVAARAARDANAAPGSRPAPERVLCCVDARMREVYFGTFAGSAGRIVAETAEAIGDPGAVTAPAGRFLAVGDGFAAYPEALAAVARAAVAVEPGLRPRARDLLPRAREELRQGRVLALEAALPVYLREADAWRRS